MALLRKGILRSGGVIAVLGITVLLIGTSAASAASARPDLVSSAPSLTPNRVTAGGEVAASSVIRNKGKRTAARSITIFYVSVDDKFDKSDVLAGGFKTPKLKPGKSKRGKFSFKIPIDFPAFTFRVLSCADAIKGIPEKVEKNNCSASLLSIKKGTAPPVVTPPVVTPPADADGDGVPDSTDKCPTEGLYCSVSVSSIKDSTTVGAAAVGDPVRVSGLIVTARKGGRVWAQTTSGPPSFSAIEIVFPSSEPINSGDIITASGTVTPSRKLSAVSHSVTETGQTVPDPLVVTASELEANSVAYDSLLARIDNSAYEDAYLVDHWLMSDGDPFVVFDTLTSLGAPGTAYTSITGIATDDNTNVGLMPRSSADIVEAP